MDYRDDKFIPGDDVESSRSSQEELSSAEEDDESTIAEQEAAELEDNEGDELAMLREEQEVSLDGLIKMYGPPGSASADVSTSGGDLPTTFPSCSNETKRSDSDVITPNSVENQDGDCGQPLLLEQDVEFIPGEDQAGLKKDGSSDSDREDGNEDPGSSSDDVEFSADIDDPDELSDLRREQDLPVDEVLLQSYSHSYYTHTGRKAGESSSAGMLEEQGILPGLMGNGEYGKRTTPMETSGTSSSEDEILSNRDLTLNKEDIPNELVGVDDCPTSVDELISSVGTDSSCTNPDSMDPFKSREDGHGYFSDLGEEGEDEEDEDFVPELWRRFTKDIRVGEEYQADLPQFIGDASTSSDLDTAVINGTSSDPGVLVWKPVPQNSETDVSNYLRSVRETSLLKSQGVVVIPLTWGLSDDETALEMLLNCKYDAPQALRKYTQELLSPPNHFCLRKNWSDAEIGSFEEGLKVHGKNFHVIRREQLPHKNVSDLVHFYYFWKKSNRRQEFVQRLRLERHQAVLNAHPYLSEYMDHFTYQLGRAEGGSCEGGDENSSGGASPSPPFDLAGMPTEENGNGIGGSSEGSRSDGSQGADVHMAGPSVDPNVLMNGQPAVVIDFPHGSNDQMVDVMGPVESEIGPVYPDGNASASEEKLTYEPPDLVLLPGGPIGAECCDLAPSNGVPQVNAMVPAFHGVANISSSNSGVLNGGVASSVAPSSSPIIGAVNELSLPQSPPNPSWICAMKQPQQHLSPPPTENDPSISTDDRSPAAPSGNCYYLPMINPGIDDPVIQHNPNPSPQPNGRHPNNQSHANDNQLSPDVFAPPPLPLDSENL